MQWLRSSSSLLTNALRALTQFDEAAASYSEAIRIDPSSAQAYMDRGVVFQMTGRLDYAVRDYDTALSLRPSHVPTLYNRAGAYRRQGRLAEAIADYRKVLELAPSFEPARQRLRDLAAEAP